jgi:hypothetical protein
MNQLIQELNQVKLNLLTYSEVATAKSDLVSSYLAQAADKVSAAIQQINREAYLKQEKITHDLPNSDRS